MIIIYSKDMKITGIKFVMSENKDQNIQKVYQQIIEIFQKYQAQKVILLGSRARGINLPKGDIDLTIYGCKDFKNLSDSLNEDLWSFRKLDIINMDDKYLSSELNRKRSFHMQYESSFFLLQFTIFQIPEYVLEGHLP